MPGREAGSRPGQGVDVARDPNQLLLPANPVFVAFTLFVALALDSVQISRTPALPDMLAVVLVFWNVHQPRPVWVSAQAFFFGLLMDVHDSALLGQHALAYTLFSLRSACTGACCGSVCRARPSRSCRCLRRRIAVSFVVRMLAGGMLPGWTLVLAPVVEALLWPVVTWLLLAPQRRAPDPMQNQPCVHLAILGVRGRKSHSTIGVWPLRSGWSIAASDTIAAAASMLRT